MANGGASPSLFERWAPFLLTLVVLGVGYVAATARNEERTAQAYAALQDLRTLERSVLILQQENDTDRRDTEAREARRDARDAGQENRIAAIESRINARAAQLEAELADIQRTLDTIVASAPPRLPPALRHE